MSYALDVSHARQLTPAERVRAGRALGFADAHDCVPVVVIGSSLLHLSERDGRLNCNYHGRDAELYDARLFDTLRSYCTACAKSARVMRARRVANGGGER